MTEVVVSVTRPEICFIGNLNEYPCHSNNQNDEHRFLLDHRMSVTVSIRDTETDTLKDIVELICIYVNMNNKKDIKSCKDNDLNEVIKRVKQINMPVESLIIVNSAIVERTATLEEVTQAFEKIQCVLCRAASAIFKTDHSHSIYFDYKFIQPKTAKWINASLRDYADCNMIKEKYEDGCYIHEINCETLK